jgi:hypothetical protein
LNYLTQLKKILHNSKSSQSIQTSQSFNRIFFFYEWYFKVVQ